MKRWLAPVLIVASIVVDNNTVAAADVADSTAPTVDVTEIDGLGRVLTDADGNVLYAADEEAADPDVICTDACEEFWIPVDAGSAAPTAADGVTGLDVAERPDGTTQVTLDDRRLYTFSLDSPGEAGGEGFSDTFGGQRFTWHAVVVDESGAAVTAATTGAADDSVDYPGY
jgi:predicted lipoprotein with Yx(FWY)xxD motif